MPTKSTVTQPEQAEGQRDPRYGDLVTWTKGPNAGKPRLVLSNYRLAGLVGPELGDLWALDKDQVQRLLASGDLEYCPVGTKVTLEVVE